jgi:hypothetical protein
VVAVERRRGGERRVLVTSLPLPVLAVILLCADPV